MRSEMLVFALILLVGAVSCGEKKTAESQPKTMVGSWEEIEVTQEVREATKFALGYIEESVQLDQIIRARRQVVKGYNYEIVFRLGNQETWTAVVYRDLDGNFSMKEGPERTGEE